MANAVSVKLPPFWSAQPTVWFHQAEAQFQLAQITQDATKYSHVIAALDQSTASRILDLLNNPPEENRYQSLKDRLSTTFGLSKRERAAALLHIGELGDRKPSELMDEMLALVGEHTKCILFEQVFLERMPESIRLQLSSDDSFNDPRAAAQRADELWLAQRARPLEVSSANLAAATRQRSSKNKDFCYYHNRFGVKAKKCVPPCSFSPALDSSAQGNDPAGRQ